MIILDLPVLPKRMTNALNLVREKLGYEGWEHCDKVAIVGGALRDLVIGKHREKDIDIAVFEPSGDIEKFRTIDSRIFREDENSEDSSKVIKSTRVLYRDRGLDLIFVNDERVTSVFDLLSTFDIGLCQIAHTGLHYVLHEHFVEDLANQVIRVRGGGAYGEDSIRNRVTRFAKLYPNFLVDDSLLKKLFPKDE